HSGNLLITPHIVQFALKKKGHRTWKNQSTFKNNIEDIKSVRKNQCAYIENSMLNNTVTICLTTCPFLPNFFLTDVELNTSEILKMVKLKNQLLQHIVIGESNINYEYRNTRVTNVHFTEVKVSRDCYTGPGISLCENGNNNNL
ncbi:hypothetical protein L9F63_012357, partial [Diploptera punctata]